jgi:hypothetical protein
VGFGITGVEPSGDVAVNINCEKSAELVPFLHTVSSVGDIHNRTFFE